MVPGFDRVASLIMSRAVELRGKDVNSSDKHPLDLVYGAIEIWICCICFGKFNPMINPPFHKLFAAFFGVHTEDKPQPRTRRVVKRYDGIVGIGGIISSETITRKNNKHDTAVSADET